MILRDESGCIFVLTTHLLQLIDGNEGGAHFGNVTNDGRPAADAQHKKCSFTPTCTVTIFIFMKMILLRFIASIVEL